MNGCEDFKMNITHDSANGFSILFKLPLGRWAWTSATE